MSAVTTNKRLPGETAAASSGEAVDKWRKLRWLPCDLSPQVAIAHFTVGDLLRLETGSIVSSRCSRTAEIPLYANGQLIGWTELDSVGEHIGARITELI